MIGVIKKTLVLLFSIFSLGVQADTTCKDALNHNDEKNSEVSEISSGLDNNSIMKGVETLAFREAFAQQESFFKHLDSSNDTKSNVDDNTVHSKKSMFTSTMDVVLFVLLFIFLKVHEMEDAIDKHNTSINNTQNIEPSEQNKELDSAEKL